MSEKHSIIKSDKSGKKEDSGKKKKEKKPITFTVIGQVDKTYPSEKGSTRFSIYNAAAGESYDCIYYGCFPVREGDCMETILTKSLNDEYVIDVKPFVQPTVSKQGIVQFFTKVSRYKFNGSTGTPLGNRQANLLYDKLKELAEIKGSILPEDRKYSYDVITYISELAETYNNTGNTNIIDEFQIDEEQMRKILFYWYKDRMMRRLYLLGFNNKEIKETELDLNVLFERCVKNPFTVPQISMDRCSEIFRMQGKEVTRNMIYCGKVVRELWKNTHSRGWACTKRGKLMEMFPSMGKYEEELQRNYFMVLEDDHYYFQYVNTIENEILDRVKTVTYNNFGKDVNVDDKKIIKPAIVDSIDNVSGIFKETAYFEITDSNGRDMILTDEQKAAIQGALDNPISIITGPAGSGKSSVIKCLVKNLKMRNITYAIVSFTGKAVSRLMEVLNSREPKTIHRFINSMTRDGKDASEVKLGHVIIDETSMLDFTLFWELVSVCPINTFFTLVGDPIQLPPISWGSLFEQIILSGTVPIFELTKTSRVDLDGKDDNYVDCITRNATFIRNYRSGPVELIEGDNFMIIDGRKEKVISLAKNLHARGISHSEFAVLCPVKAEISSLNTEMQKIFCGKKPFVIDKYHNRWHLGDKVVMIKNSYSIGIFNGEQGIICKIEEDRIKVDFGNSGKHYFYLEQLTEENKSKFLFEEEDDYENCDNSVKVLQLAYAITVHRSQGSEYPYVCFYLPDTIKSSSFINRRLIYTAITRPKKKIWVIGSKKLLYEGIKRNFPYRCEKLSGKLKVSLPQVVTNIDEFVDTTQTESNCGDWEDDDFDEDNYF